MNTTVIPSTTPGSNQSFPSSLKDLLTVQLLVHSLYALIFLCSIFGNSLVIFIVVTNRHMQNVTNIFITNLAVSDFIQTITSLWMTPAYIYQGNWIYGEFTCYLFGLIQGGSIFISTFTLSAIAIDRYVVILHPFRPKMSMRCCIITIFCIWTLAVIMTLPMLLKLVHAGDASKPRKFFCQEDWGQHMPLRSLYGAVVLVFQYGIPIAVNAFCYARIVRYLRSGMMSMEKARSAARHAVDVRRKQRLNQMLILMVVIFGACWLPMNALNISRDATNGLLDAQSWFELAFLLAHLLAMSSTMWNPILYAWKNEHFKAEFMAVLPCFPSVKRVLSRSATKSKCALLPAEASTFLGRNTVTYDRNEITNGATDPIDYRRSKNGFSKFRILYKTSQQQRQSLTYKNAEFV